MNYKQWFAALLLAAAASGAAAQSYPDKSIRLIVPFPPGGTLGINAEAGVTGAEATNWWGILAPAGTPAAVLGRLQREIAAILDAPEIHKRLEHEGAEALRMTAAQFGELMAAETAKWTQVVKQAGIKVE